MPLYDCMLLLKSHVNKDGLVDLVSRVGKHVYTRNGVVTDIQSLGKVQLGYGIRKLDGRHFEAQLMQMTMMVPPSFHKELLYLNKEERLLRWLVVKHRDVKLGNDFNRNDAWRYERMRHPQLTSNADDDKDEDDYDDYDDDNKEDNHEV